MTHDEWKAKLHSLIDQAIATAKKRDAAGSDDEHNALNLLLEQQGKEVMAWIPKVYEAK